jgi:hypothetical protein
MKAKEIRDARKKTLLLEGDSEFWLLEIAAQLAELNETMRPLKDAVVSLDASGIVTIKNEL